MPQAPFRPFETALDQDTALAHLRDAVAGADDGELFLERRRTEVMTFDDPPPHFVVCTPSADDVRCAVKGAAKRTEGGCAAFGIHADEFKVHYLSCEHFHHGARLCFGSYGIPGCVAVVDGC